LILHVPVHFEATLVPSRRLLTLAILAHVSTAIPVSLLLPNWRGIALVSLIVLLGLLQWRHRFRKGSPQLIGGIRYDAHGWALRYGAVATGSWRQVRLLSPVFCHQHLVVLHFTGHWLPLAVAVTHDSCSADELRRLRVLARHLPALQLWAVPR